jgi:hypothetical protein
VSVPNPIEKSRKFYKRMDALASLKEGLERLASRHEKAVLAPLMRRKPDRRALGHGTAARRIEPKDSVTVPKDNDSVPWINFESGAPVTR